MRKHLWLGLVVVVVVVGISNPQDNNNALTA